MTRRTLPGLRSETGETPFFPSFQREMNRLIDQFRSGFPVPEAASEAIFGATMFPAIDVVEKEDTLEVTAEIPGVKAQDLDVSITGEVLTLKGEKSSDHEEEKDDFHVVERRYGSFRRQIPLGFRPAEGAVETDFTDGILKLRITKPDDTSAGVQKIDIKKS